MVCVYGRVGSIKGRQLMEGKSYYDAAVALTDSHPGTQFREMLGHDSLVGDAMRSYFVGEWRKLPLMGWNTFCLKMEDAGQKKWLAKIKALDNDVILGHLEQQLMSASRNGESPNKNLLESTVKALQGVSALTKIAADSENIGSGDIPLIEVKFVPSLDKPVEPEEWERILAEKNPDLVKYFGIGKSESEQKDTSKQETCYRI